MSLLFSWQHCPEGETQARSWQGGTHSERKLPSFWSEGPGKGAPGGGSIKEENYRRESWRRGSSSSVSEPTKFSGSSISYTCVKQTQIRALNHHSQKGRQNVQSEANWVDCILTHEHQPSSESMQHNIHEVQDKTLNYQPCKNTRKMRPISFLNSLKYVGSLKAKIITLCWGSQFTQI